MVGGDFSHTPLALLINYRLWMLSQPSEDALSGEFYDSLDLYRNPKYFVIIRILFPDVSFPINTDKIVIYNYYIIIFYCIAC